MGIHRVQTNKLSEYRNIVAPSFRIRRGYSGKGAGKVGKERRREEGVGVIVGWLDPVLWIHGRSRGQRKRGVYGAWSIWRMQNAEAGCPLLSQQPQGTTNVRARELGSGWYVHTRVIRVRVFQHWGRGNTEREREREGEGESRLRGRRRRESSCESTATRKAIISTGRNQPSDTRTRLRLRSYFFQHTLPTTTKTLPLLLESINMCTSRSLRGYDPGKLDNELRVVPSSGTPVTMRDTSTPVNGRRTLRQTAERLYENTGPDHAFIPLSPSGKSLVSILFSKPP